jgi:serine/threonine protein kinase
MSLAPGTRLGTYEIQSTLVAGGMGEVYRAHDTKLNRDVAVNVVADDFVHDPPIPRSLDPGSIDTSRVPG